MLEDENNKESELKIEDVVDDFNMFDFPYVVELCNEGLTLSAKAISQLNDVIQNHYFTSKKLEINMKLEKGERIKKTIRGWSLAFSVMGIINYFLPLNKDVSFAVTSSLITILVVMWSTFTAKYSMSKKKFNKILHNDIKEKYPEIYKKVSLVEEYDQKIMSLLNRSGKYSANQQNLDKLKSLLVYTNKVCDIALEASKELLLVSADSEKRVFNHE